LAPHLECKRLDGRGDTQLYEEGEARPVEDALVRSLPGALAKHARELGAND
jgi:hypothetical protein